MRQNQQNRRMRGRGNSGGSSNNNNNNNRRGPNPLTRSYESNGPDVKVRGTAQNVADKYLQLARDAHSSGDRVMAENYLQHAEHYNRIIATAMAQQQAQREQRDVEEDEDLTDNSDNRFADNPNSMREQQEPAEQAAPVYDGEQPQPLIAAATEGGQPQEVSVPRENNRPPREPREPRAAGGEDREGFRSRRRERGPRPPRAETAIDPAGEQPDAGGLLATLSRGPEKPMPVAEPVDE